MGDYRNMHPDWADLEEENERLKAKIDAARALHEPDERGYCVMCFGPHRHPCPTIKALRGQE